VQDIQFLGLVKTLKNDYNTNNSCFCLWQFNWGWVSSKRKSNWGL